MTPTKVHKWSLSRVSLNASTALQGQSNQGVRLAREGLDHSIRQAICSRNVKHKQGKPRSAKSMREKVTVITTWGTNAAVVH